MLAAPLKLAESYLAVRAETERLCAPLEVEDYQLQSMPDASPAKWHLAHTTWFFETFLLAGYEPGFDPVHPQFGYLFNSYYDAVGDRWPRASRGLLSRPTVAEVYAYRRAVDERMSALIATARENFGAFASLVELGLNHEQQHQELLLADLKHAFGLNPLRPAYASPVQAAADRAAPSLQWRSYPPGVRRIGHAADGFAFDNEGPNHNVYVDGFEIASRPVTVGEFLAFMEAGGYEHPEYWLSDGWAARRRNGWLAPLYWERGSCGWSLFTLRGLRPLDPTEPVCHLSFYEADAYARWAGARLPTEFEWETAAGDIHGNFLDSDLLHPTSEISGWYGNVWVWTASPYVAYPGYRPASGAIGEYNGKFMCNQMVLRGGSCVTPAGHIRRTYRNFFPPDARWQFFRPPTCEGRADLTTICAEQRSNHQFQSDILAGLSRQHKKLPSKYFYDAAGSRLFDQITELDEYYPTRTELELMHAHAPAMASRCGPRALLIELGAGSLVKVRLLLDKLERPAGYVPVDVSGEHLRAAAKELAISYPGLGIFPVVSDFTRPFKVPPVAAARRVVYFPGSTIGNFDPAEADTLLSNIARLAGHGGGLLLGVDLRKDPAILERAYNDARGVTAAFNKNLLVRINRELGADFDPAQFRHLAYYNIERSRIEMHLVSAVKQEVRVGDQVFAFRAGESIHTENSYKYDLAELDRRAAACGLHVDATWIDENNYFAVLYLNTMD